AKSLTVFVGDAREVLCAEIATHHRRGKCSVLGSAAFSGCFRFGRQACPSCRVLLDRYAEDAMLAAADKLAVHDVQLVAARYTLGRRPNFLQIECHPL